MALAKIASRMMARPDTTAENASGPLPDSAPARPSTITITGFTRITAIMIPAHRLTWCHMFLSTRPAYTAVPSSAPTYSSAARITSSSQSTPAASTDTIDTTISMIGPPPMSVPFFRAPENPPKNTFVSDFVPEEMTCVTASVADTTVYRISGVNADASTVSHRKPTASVSASVIGTPRTARLATASSHRISVRIVDAAKTTAYCRRNEVLVKSTSVVFVTAEDSLSIVHEAASAQPLASEVSGSSELVGSVTLGVWPLVPLRQ